MNDYMSVGGDEDEDEDEDDPDAEDGTDGQDEGETSD
jgi:hypothetical protein